LALQCIKRNAYKQMERIWQICEENEEEEEELIAFGS
jgi:hypothetical protein